MIYSYTFQVDKGSSTSSSNSTDILHVSLNCLVRMCKESPSRWKLIDGQFHHLFLHFLATSQFSLHKLHPKLLEALNCFVHDDAAFKDFLQRGLVDILVDKLTSMMVDVRHKQEESKGIAINKSSEGINATSEEQPPRNERECGGKGVNTGNSGSSHSKSKSESTMTEASDPSVEGRVESKENSASDKSHIAAGRPFDQLSFEFRSFDCQSKDLGKRGSQESFLQCLSEAFPFIGDFDDSFSMDTNKEEVNEKALSDDFAGSCHGRQVGKDAEGDQGHQNDQDFSQPRYSINSPTYQAEVKFSQSDCSDNHKQKSLQQQNEDFYGVFGGGSSPLGWSPRGAASSPDSSSAAFSFCR